METVDKRTKMIIYIMMGIVIVIMSAAIYFLCFSHAKDEKTISMQEEKIHIDYAGAYHEIKMKDIHHITLLQKLPSGGKFGSGIETNDYIAGDAKFEGIGKCKAYVMKKSSPIIIIQTKDEIYLINAESSIKTKEVFEHVKQKAPIK